MSEPEFTLTDAVLYVRSLREELESQPRQQFFSLTRTKLKMLFAVLDMHDED